MAFNVSGIVQNCEVRRVLSGARRKDGEPYRILKCEDSNGDAFEVTCSDKSLFDDVDNLHKGDMVDLPCVFIASADYSFIRLAACPVILDA